MFTIDTDQIHLAYSEIFVNLWNHGITLRKHLGYYKFGWSTVENIALALNLPIREVRNGLGYFWYNERLFTSNEWFKENENRSLFSYTVYMDCADCRADRGTERLIAECHSLEMARIRECQRLASAQPTRLTRSY